MSKNKNGELSLVALLALLFGAVVFVSAQVLNSTDNSSFINLNESINLNQTTINETANLTIPTENISINQSTNLSLLIDNLTTNQSINLTLNKTTNITLPEIPIKNLTKIVELNKNKLNNETEKYLKNIKDKKEIKNYIIKFKDSIDENELVNVTLEKKIEKFKVTKIRGEAEDIEDLIEDNEIEFIELEQEVKVLGDNIPFNIKKIKADSAWNSSKGSNVKVAVLDTGIGAHNDLAVAGGVSFVDNDYFDSNGHGTSVAGVISALLNDEGLVGVAPEVSLYSVKIMQGSIGDLSNAIAGIEWAINNSMDIASMSFGFNSYSQIFKEVLQEAYNNNIVLVAASGNEGTDNILYPAKYDTVIAVGAVDSNDNLASFSSYGFEQELVAPGVDINSTSLNNQYSVSSGTSMAAPHVAGVAALIKSFNKSLTNEQIRAKLRNDALDLGQSGKDDLFGYGLVQVKLNTTNYTFIRETYYYEVYNITNYFSDPNQYQLWKTANGTVDDVDFANGYYWIKIFRDGNQYKYLYKISENQTIKLLSASAVLHDDFSLDGSTTTDGKVWLNGVLKVHNYDQQAGLDAECFDYDSDLSGVPDFDECRYKNATAKTDCATFSSSFGTTSSYRAFYQVCNEGGSGDVCQEGGIGINHSIANTSQQLFPRYAEVVSYHYCASAQDQIATSDSPSYYVFDIKRSICEGALAYQIQGRGSITGNPPTDDWVNYANPSCSSGTRCNPDLTGQIVSFKNQVVPNPCVSLCSGSIYAVSVDSKGKPRENDIIKVNNLQNGTTNNNGEHKINFTNAACGLKYNISAYCSHNASKLCTPSQKQSSLDFQNDNDTIIFDCNICVNSSDLFISLSDIKVRQVNGNIYGINVTIHTENINSNVNVTIRGQNKNTGLTERENSSIVPVSNTNTTAEIVVNLDTTNVDYLNIYVDPNNQISEPKTNNYVLRPFIRNPVKAYLEVKTGYDKADQAIESYLELFIDKQPSLSSNYLNIIVGKNGDTFKDKVNPYTSKTIGRMQNPYFFDGKSIKYNNAYIGYTPYIGIAGGFWNKDDFNRRYVVAYGKEIEGDIAAVKKLVSAQSLFLTEGSSSFDERTIILDNFDVTGISVMDLFHSIENKPFYNQRGSNNFKAVVERILNDNNFEIAIKTVKTTDGTSYGQNTTLRLKNVNTDYSANFKDAIVKNAKPVVLARGLWSNLLTWESFGKELSSDPENARDTWLIELTGGPTQDCDTCPNYKYEDLVDYYWTALIAGVEKYSGQNKLDYAGFSNGCRVALDSLKNWSAGKNNAGYYFDTTTGSYQLMDLASTPVDTFVGVGCPGAFINESLYSKCWGKYANQLRQKLISKNHISPNDVGKALLEVSSSTDLECKTAAGILSLSDGAISYNLADKYLNFIESNSDNQLGNNINVNRFVLIRGTTPIPYGNIFGIPSIYFTKTDLVVTKEDEDAIYSNVNSNQKFYYLSIGAHAAPVSLLSLADSFITKSIITDLVNGKNRTSYEFLLLNKTG